jgi:hypothetical protein
MNYEISNDIKSPANIGLIEFKEDEIDIQIDILENNNKDNEIVIKNENINLDFSLSSIHSKRSEHFPDDSLKKIKLWRSVKLYTIFSCVGICIILYIILPFFIDSSGSILGPNPSNSTNINLKSFKLNSIKN